MKTAMPRKSELFMLILRKGRHGCDPVAAAGVPAIYPHLDAAKVRTRNALYNNMVSYFFNNDIAITPTPATS